MRNIYYILFNILKLINLKNKLGGVYEEKHDQRIEDVIWTKNFI